MEETFKQRITEAMRYWEPRRLVYNTALALVVIGCFLTALPRSKEQLNVALGLFVFVLAVLANVAYCAAYVVDLFAQASDYREVWLRFRWILLAVGVAFAGTLTWFFSQALFGMQ